MRYDELPQRDYDDATSQCPVRFLAECRRATPLLRLTSAHPEKNVLLVTRAADVLQVAADAETFSSRAHPQALRFDSDYDPQAACIYARRGRNLKNVLVWADGAEHARVRKLVQGAFTVPKVKLKEPYIRVFIDTLIDAFPAHGGVEFMRAFAWQLPLEVITREYGLPASDKAVIQDATNKLSAMLDPLGPANAAVIAADAISTLQDMLMQRLNQIDRLPDHTLLKDLALAQADGEPSLSSEELMWLSSILLPAGAHTTGAMLGWCLSILATDAALQQELRRHPERIEVFVEETLRMHEPVPTSYRTATRDTKLGDVEIPKGTWLLIRWDSVNFDATQWTDAERFDMQRPNVRKHSTFGHGKHFCVGNSLGRAELRLAIETMLRRFAAIALALPAEQIEPFPSFDLHAIVALPLQLTPATRLEPSHG